MGDRHLIRERMRRLVFAVVLALVILFAVALLVEAVEDSPDGEVKTVTDPG